MKNQKDNKHKEEKVEEFIELKKDETEVNLMPPLTWAYIGDCVYEL